MSAKDLTKERKNVHGNWTDQAGLSHSLKIEMHRNPGWDRLLPTQREALDMIAVKISRIIHGDPTHADHWDDIEGYALLGKEGHS